MLNPNGVIRMGWLEAFGLLGVSAVVGAVVTISVPGRHTAPELLRGLSDEPQAASRQFAERLRSTLPAGISDDKVIEALSAQGFTIRRRQPLTEQVQYATFVISNVACARNVHVAWRVDASGHAIGVEGGIDEPMCW